ncbi:ribosomal RNA small subunit methyltransferase A, partial [Candidatus Pelagibacter bacterium]|nr:ribosomal RNA small subunit methyltransferase A [Candidatus Pelagibacter bacterium]
RIASEFNSKHYSRLSIISKWRLDVEKICDIKPSSFSPKPKVDSSLIFFKPKENYYKFKDSKNLEKVTRIFFMHKRKMIRKPYNQMFNGKTYVADKLKIDLSLRPQNLNFETFYNLTREYENLRG